MTRRLVLAFTLVAAVVALALAVPLALLVAHDQRSALVSNLEVQALAAASVLASQPQSAWPATVAAVAADTGARVVVVDPQARLVADSDESGLDRLFTRPEIAAALQGQLASDVRPSTTLGTDLRYVAAPVVQQEEIAAAVRLSLPEDAVTSTVRSTQGWLAVFVLAVVVIAALIGWLMARSLAAPLSRLAVVAEGLPDDLSLRAREDDGPREVRSVARALNSTAGRLAALLSRSERVAAEASHHLRTPLTGVRLRLEAIEDMAREPEVAAQATAATVEVDRLARRVDQVLALARVDAGRMPTQTIDLSAVVVERVAAASPLASAAGVQIETDVDPRLMVDDVPGTVPRIVDELLGNAMSYARARVRVSAQQTPDGVVLAVEDDGPGLPEDQREAVFERFVRGSGAVAGGSGLGLALVREGARASGGDALAAASALGGLSVVVSWPPRGPTRSAARAEST